MPKGKVTRFHATLVAGEYQTHVMLEGDPAVYKGNASIRDPEGLSHLLMTAPGDIVEFNFSGRWGSDWLLDFKNHTVAQPSDMLG